MKKSIFIVALSISAIVLTPNGVSAQWSDKHEITDDFGDFTGQVSYVWLDEANDTQVLLLTKDGQITSIGLYGSEIHCGDADATVEYGKIYRTGTHFSYIKVLYQGKSKPETAKVLLTPYDPVGFVTDGCKGVTVHRGTKGSTYIPDQTFNIVLKALQSGNKVSFRWGSSKLIYNGEPLPEDLLSKLR